MSRPVLASAAKVKRRASVPNSGMPCGELLAGRLLDLRPEVRLHQARGPLGHQRFQVHPVDEVERVEDIALGLRHLLAVLVADQAGDVDLAERHVAGELQSHHDHAGDPEENDVEAGDQHVRRVEGLQFRGGLRPAQRRERPEGRGEPGVENILVLAQGEARRQPVAQRALRSRCARHRLVPSLSYQAGMRCPHQSWRLMHQSWMLRIHWK